MKEDKFTPGPWVIEKKAPHGFFILNSADLKHDMGLVIIRNKDDAELIARAPDLLRENRELKEENKRLREAIKEAIGYCEAYLSPGSGVKKILKEALEGEYGVIEHANKCY